MWVEQNPQYATEWGWCSYTSECVRNNVTSKKDAEKHYIPCRRMHERETVMQSGENRAVLVVCVCEAIFVFKNTNTL